LSGGDLRSIGNSSSIVKSIKSQADFDDLFHCLFDDDRVVVMRAADVIEKITVRSPEFLFKHKARILSLAKVAIDKELVWHLAQLIPRLKLNTADLRRAKKILHQWATDKSCSRIVRVNALDGLFQLTAIRNRRDSGLGKLLESLERENIPSLKTRIKKIRRLQTQGNHNQK
jgi:hypothetical protein